MEIEVSTETKDKRLDRAVAITVGALSVVRAPIGSKMMGGSELRTRSAKAETAARRPTLSMSASGACRTTADQGDQPVSAYDVSGTHGLNRKKVATCILS